VHRGGQLIRRVAVDCGPEHLRDQVVGEGVAPLSEHVVDVGVKLFPGAQGLAGASRMLTPFARPVCPATPVKLHARPNNMPE
jgi:hypothetical protein